MMKFDSSQNSCIGQGEKLISYQTVWRELQAQPSQQTSFCFWFYLSNQGYMLDKPILC